MRIDRVTAVVVAALMWSSLASAQGASTDSAARRRAIQERQEIRDERGMRDMRMMHGDHGEMGGARGPRGPLRGIRLTDAERDKVKAIHERAMLEVRAALTSEHQVQFDANVARMTKRREAWEQGGRGPRGPGRMPDRPEGER